MAPAAGGNWSQYHDYANQETAGSKLTQDLEQDSETKRKLKLLNDGIELNQDHQKRLFSVIIWITIFSLGFVVLINGLAAVFGTQLAPSVLVSFNASIAVQSFLLLGALARSLFPSPARQTKEEKSE